MPCTEIFAVTDTPAKPPDHQTQKISIYFFGQGDGSTRILDAEKPPTPHGWTIGRAQESEICWRNVLVSKHHACINAAINKDLSIKNDAPVWDWKLTDMGDGGRGSTNGTFLGTYRIAPGIPYALSDRDVVQFGSNQCKVRVSFDLDDTTNTPLAETAGSRERASTWLDLIAEWVPAAWAWFTAKSPREQFAWFLLIALGALLAFWIHKN